MCALIIIIIPPPFFSIFPSKYLIFPLSKRLLFFFLFKHNCTKCKKRMECYKIFGTSHICTPHSQFDLIVISFFSFLSCFFIINQERERFVDTLQAGGMHFDSGCTPFLTKGRDLRSCTTDETEKSSFAYIYTTYRAMFNLANR